MDALGSTAASGLTPGPGSDGGDSSAIACANVRYGLALRMIGQGADVRLLSAISADARVLATCFAYFRFDRNEISPGCASSRPVTRRTSTRPSPSSGQPNNLASSDSCMTRSARYLRMRAGVRGPSSGSFGLPAFSQAASHALATALAESLMRFSAAASAPFFAKSAK